MTRAITLAQIISTRRQEDHQGMKEWLKHHTEPATKVKKFMEKTVINRAKWIRENKDLPIQTVITEYPRLFDTPGMVSCN